MHHPFYNHDGSKLYNTVLSGERLYHVNLHEDKIFDVTPIDTDSYQVDEDMHFNRDGEKYFLTCMGSDNVIIFDGNTDKKIDEISSKKEQNLQFSSEEIENSLIQIIKNTK